MTREDKELLLRDLCARLPYGVIIQEYCEEYGYSDNALNTIGIGYFSIHEASIEGTWINHIENVKPYLLSISSMTEEERTKYLNACGNEMDNALSSPRYSGIDWLNEHHFDFRGLIPKGLAIAVTEDNNPYK